jgi:hypothetical protein
LNGSNASTGASNRSASISVNPSAREAPPLTMIRSIRSDEAVALKKSNVFWISSSTFSLTARSTGRASSNVTPSTATPRFSSSACSNGRLSSRCSASV